MRRLSTAVVILMAITFLLSGCGGITRYGFDTDTGNYWTQNNALFILPIGVMNDYLPSGNDDVDKQVTLNTAKLDNEILAYVKKVNPKLSIIAIPVEQAQKDIETILKKSNVKGFYVSEGFDGALYSKSIKELSEQYKGRILAPRLIKRTAHCQHKSHLLSMGLTGGWYAEWDGVDDRSASAIIGPFGNIGHSQYGVSIDALSLNIEIYSFKGREYWAYGGFEVLTLVKAFGKVEQRKPEEIFSSSDTISNIKKSVALCLEPFFDKTL